MDDAPSTAPATGIAPELRERIRWQAPDGEHPARRISQASYSAVVVKDKERWLSLFADDARLEDPVGPSFFDPEGHGHQGKAAIDRENRDRRFGGSAERGRTCPPGGSRRGSCCT